MWSPMGGWGKGGMNTVKEEDHGCDCWDHHLGVTDVVTLTHGLDE